MKAKKMGKPEGTRMATVQCYICCTDLLAEGYEPEELKMDKKSLARHFARCDEVAEEMLDLAFYGYWKKVEEQGMKHYNYEALAKMFFIQGASSKLGLLISQGMPLPFLDDLEEAIREAKRGMGKKLL